jgi:hypothetical protein
MRTALCDPSAFYPLRRLVSGPFSHLPDLLAIERLIRTVVLHDEIIMFVDPLPRSSQPSEPGWEDSDGHRSVMVGLGPSLKGYDFFSDRLDCALFELGEGIELTQSFVELAARYANRENYDDSLGLDKLTGHGTGMVYRATDCQALTVHDITSEDGDVHFKTHVEYLRSVLGVVQRGGSALLDGEFGRAAIATARTYPEAIFQHLDEEWRTYAREAADSGLGLLVPPLLGVVLGRCARRSAIPQVISDLRDEWTDARRKIWERLDALRVCRTFAEGQEIRRELNAASRLLATQQGDFDTRPLRVFWELVVAGGAGALIGEISAGNPGIGAATGVLSRLPLLAGVVHEFGPMLFGRGAFDLARRVRRAVSTAELSALARLLSDAEKQSLVVR